MRLSISKEDEVVLNELKNDLILIKQKFKSGCLHLISVLLNGLYNFILSYREYSLENIKRKGFKEVLYRRALRFFKLEQNESRKSKKKTVSRKKSKRRIIIKLFKFVLTPIYLLIIAFMLITKKNKYKNVNIYNDN